MISLLVDVAYSRNMLFVVLLLDELQHQLSREIKTIGKGDCICEYVEKLLTLYLSRENLVLEGDQQKKHQLDSYRWYFLLKIPPMYQVGE